MAVLPAARPTRRNVPELFKNRPEITIKDDAKVYITPRNIPEHDRFLKAYSTETAGKVGSVVPGLLSITDQAYRAQIRPEGKDAYTLADAMRDAIWRKNMAAKLKTLLSARGRLCERREGPEPLFIDWLRVRMPVPRI